MAVDEDEYSSCVIDCLVYGDQTTARESAEIGEDVPEEAGASNEVVQVQPSETTVRTNCLTQVVPFVPLDCTEHTFGQGQGSGDES